METPGTLSLPLSPDGQSERTSQTMHEFKWFPLGRQPHLAAIPPLISIAAPWDEANIVRAGTKPVCVRKEPQKMQLSHWLCTVACGLSALGVSNLK